MPELPEVEHLRRTLAPTLSGRTIRKVEVFRKSVVHPHPRTAPLATALLKDATVAALERRGKQLAIRADDSRTLCVHLGMTGQLLRRPSTPAKAPAHTHVRWTLDDGSHLLFRDPRRFGRIDTYKTHQALLDHRWSLLGPDALSITRRQLQAALGSRSRSVKAALLDQTIIAGIGNIYADESLFDARIHPNLPCKKLTGKDLAALAVSLRNVLALATRSGGSTIRDYTDSTGAKGNHQNAHAVYGRGGRPCLICSTTLDKATIAQRTTVSCPRCQHLP